MTIEAKQEWCPLCSMVHEKDLHIHEQLEQMKKDIKKLCDLLFSTTGASTDFTQFDENYSFIEKMKNKYNV